MMQDSDAPLQMIDEAAMAAAELRHDPYDFCFRRARTAATAEGAGAGGRTESFPTAAATACPTCTTDPSSAR